MFGNCRVTYFFKAFRITFAAMGAATSAPKPAFSMNTAMAICGLYIGAKAMKAEWSLPSFSTVPVLPQMLYSFVLIYLVFKH